MGKVPEHIFYHHDRVVNHKPDANGHRAQRHEVQREACQPHEQERDEDRHWDNCRSGERGADVAQEHQQDDHGEQSPDEDRVANAADGFLDQDALVVEHAGLCPGRKSPLQRRHFGLDSLGHGNRVRVRLPHDVDEHRFRAVRRHHGHAILARGVDIRHHFQRHRNAVALHQDRAAQVARGLRLAGHQHLVRLVLTVYASDGADDVGLSQSLTHFREREVESREALRVNVHRYLRRPAALHHHPRHARHPRQPWTNRVSGKAPEFSLRERGRAQ